MDPVAAIGLAFAVIKMAFAIIDFLRAHPAIGADARAALDKAADALNATRDHIQTAHETYEAP